MSQVIDPQLVAYPARADSNDAQSFLPLSPAIKVLMIWPRFPFSSWSFYGVMELIPEETDQPPSRAVPQELATELVDRSFADLLDSDILWADLVMVSGMRVRKDDVREVLLRSRALGRRTMIGGPYASSEPESLLPLADHVVVGEPDEIFDRIAVDFEQGSARRLYVIDDKPDIGRTPIPRFDLLKSKSMSPWLCSFRVAVHSSASFAKSLPMAGSPEPSHRISCWRSSMHCTSLAGAVRFSSWTTILSGNHKRALELVRSLEEWQRSHAHPFMFTRNPLFTISSLIGAKTHVRQSSYPGRGSFGPLSQPRDPMGIACDSPRRA